MSEDLLNSLEINDNRDSLKSKLQWLMLLRIAVATTLLVTAILAQFREQTTVPNSIIYIFYLLSALVFFLSILYIPIINYSKNLTSVANSQGITDILIVSFVLYISGGASSPLSFLYILVIMSSTIVSSRKGGYWAASLSSVCYGLIVNFEYYHLLPSMSEIIADKPPQTPENVLYDTAANIIAFYLVSFLSGYLAMEAQRAEKALIEKKIDYQALKALNNDIVKNISSGLMTIDKEGHITSFNSAAEVITGYTLEEVYNKKIGKLFPDLNNKISFNEFPSNKIMSRWDTSFTRSDGKIYYLGFSVSPLRDSNNNQIGRIVIFQDLTALKNMETELKKADRLAAIGRFAAGVAHEIRNPLASISGSIEILQKKLNGKTNDENKKLMRIVLREIERLDTLITEFLNYARPVNPKKEKLDLNNILTETLALFKYSRTLGDCIEFKSKLGELPLISVDGAQIKQVMWNLINNACEASKKEGNVEIETSCRMEADAQRAVIVVKDRGCGIPPENLEKIFDPFFTSKDSGLGLGLSIVNNIVDAHGGSLEVESTPGKGTIFMVTIPA